jgi:tripartite-type tricarboxylate transporter receptor subunit TctC
MRMLARCALFLSTAFCLHGAEAQDFYKGKQVSILVGSDAGSANDAYARFLARHLGRHLPGAPNIIVQNVPGASGITAAAQLFNTSPRDGTVIAALQRTLLLDPLLLTRSFPYKINEFNWVGSLNRETNVLVVGEKSKLRSFEDALSHEAILAAAAPDTDGMIYPKLMNEFLGTKFRVVPGYGGDGAMMLAIERGEVEGRGGVPWSAIKLSSADKLRDGRIRLLLQLGTMRSAELPTLPNLMEFVKNDTQRSVFELLFARQDMGRPIGAPPGLPEERVAMLRQALADTVQDPQFLAEAKKLNVDIDLMRGEEMQQLLAKLYELPIETLEAARGAIHRATQN